MPIGHARECHNYQRAFEMREVVSRSERRILRRNDCDIQVGLQSDDRGYTTKRKSTQCVCGLLECIMAAGPARQGGGRVPSSPFSRDNHGWRKAVGDVEPAASRDSRLAYFRLVRQVGRLHLPRSPGGCFWRSAGARGTVPNPGSDWRQKHKLAHSILLSSHASV